MPCHVLARRCRRFRGLRGDALFELADAVLCSDRPVRSLVQLSLEPEFRRGHGALYDALAAGRVDDERLFSLLAGVLPPLVDGPEARAWIAERDVTDRGMLDQALSGVPAADAARVRDACARWSRARIAVDATSYPRPDAWCSPGREHVHHGACHCRGSSKTTPGWEYQLAAVTGHLRTAWAAVVDVRRTIPATRTAQTIAQVKSVLRRLPASEAVPLFVFDAGYSAAALTDGLADCPAHVLVRLPAGSVFYQDAPSWPGKNGRPAHRGRRSTAWSRRPSRRMARASGSRGRKKPLPPAPEPDETLVLDETFVPDERSVLRADVAAGQGSSSAAACHTALMSAISGLPFAGPALGAVRGMLAGWTASTAQKIKQETRAGFADTLARSAGGIDVAALLLERVATTADRGDLTPLTVSRGARDGSLGVSYLLTAANRLFGAAGTSAHGDNSPIGRAWRDAHTAASHLALRFEPAAAAFASEYLGVAR